MLSHSSTDSAAWSENPWRGEDLLQVIEPAALTVEAPTGGQYGATS